MRHCSVRLYSVPTDLLCFGTQRRWRPFGGRSHGLCVVPKIAKLPSPTIENQKFCSPLEIAPSFAVDAYVPTAGERSGNFSRSGFLGLLLDPANCQPFPGTIIPASRIAVPFAWRIAATQESGLTLEIKMSMVCNQTGDIAPVSSYRLTNAIDTSISVELKAWQITPGADPVTYDNRGADGFVTVDSSVPLGTYEFGARLPITGKQLSMRRYPFLIP